MDLSSGYVLAGILPSLRSSSCAQPCSGHSTYLLRSTRSETLWRWRERFRPALSLRGLSSHRDLSYHDVDADNPMQACARVRLHIESTLSGERTVGAGSVFDRLNRFIKSITMQYYPFLRPLNVEYLNRYRPFAKDFLH